MAICQKVNFRNYSVVNGLGGASVNNIYQDSKGYIWFAIQGGGISRFNGKEFKTYTKFDGLIGNDVTCVTEDKIGHIWIGTSTGASEFDGIKFKNYSKNQGLTDLPVYGIYADRTNKIWFATKGAGIKIYDHHNFDSLTVRSGLPSDEAYTVIQDRVGKYWFGMSGGIASYDGKSVLNYGSNAELKGKTFFSVLLDHDGRIWYGSISGDIVFFSPDMSLHLLPLPENVKGSFIASMAQDHKGALWFSTDFGLLKYNNSKFKLYTEKEGLSVNAVQCVFADYEDHIWAGTFSGGVNLLISEAFSAYTDKDGLASNNVTAICKGRSGIRYYIGTGNGLFIFDPRAKMRFRKVGIRGLPDALNISSASIDNQGQLWIIAQSGIYVLDISTEAIYLVKSYISLCDAQIISPQQAIHDIKGNTWIATFGSGLLRISEDGNKCYNRENGFYSDMLFTVFEDRKKNIWIGTQDAGVIKYDGSKFEQFNPAKGFPDMAVWSIAEDQNGNMFFGMGEKGLCRYDGKAFQTYSTKDGLCSNIVTSLAWDSLENALWLGAERGLNKITFKRDGKIDLLRSYNEHDGFTSVGVNQNAILCEGNGAVWLGAITGLWFFDRHYDAPASIVPKVLLSGVRLAYNKVDWHQYADSIDAQTQLPKDLTLSYRNNHLVFDIQAMTSDDVRYSFKMDGYDNDWSPLSKNNEISYSNISPGLTYTFRAKAINSRGGESAETVPFSFAVTSPWWATWWFRICCLLLTGAGIWSYIYIREGMLRQQNMKLEHTVEERTQEIAQQKKIVEERNEKITRQKELVEQTLSEKEVLLGEKEVLLREIHHRVKNNLQTISSMLMLQGAALKDEQSKKVIMESQNRVRSIALVHQKLYQTDGLEKVEFNVFLHDLAEQVMSVYRDQAAHVRVSYDIPETYLLIDTAIPFGLILNELLTNSFKYAFADTEEGQIIMALEYMDSGMQPAEGRIVRKTVQFTYRDSGPGLKTETQLQSATTLGLKLIRLLSQQIGAKVSYSSTHGSEFIFTFAFSS